MDDQPMETLTPEVLEPEEAAPPETPPASVVMPLDWTGPNYHISLWDEPVTYLCLPCNASGMTLPDVETHLTSTHGLTPTPTPLAADYADNQSPLRSLRVAVNDPTYYTQPGPDGMLRYYCLVCERAGVEHWSSDFVLFSQHQEQRHGGQLILDEARSTGQQAETGEVPASEPPEPGEPSEQALQSGASQASASQEEPPREPED
jgi:hypothetical protein